MKKLLQFFGLKFKATQHKWGRKLFGGTYYYINVTGLGMTLWSDKEITSCQAKTITTEVY